MGVSQQPPRVCDANRRGVGGGEEEGGSRLPGIDPTAAVADDVKGENAVVALTTWWVNV